MPEELHPLQGTRFTMFHEMHTDVGPCRFTICIECGATVMMTPGSGTAPLDLHDRWHDNIVVALSLAMTEDTP